MRTPLRHEAFLSGSDHLMLSDRQGGSKASPQPSPPRYYPLFHKSRGPQEPRQLSHTQASLINSTATNMILLCYILDFSSIQGPPLMYRTPSPQVHFQINHASRNPRILDATVTPCFVARCRMSNTLLRESN